MDSTDSLKPCGAKTKGTGAPCRRLAGKNGRCKLHGGRSTGPRTKAGRLQPHSRRNWRHGVYARKLTEEEIRRVPDFLALLGTLDEEIFIARVMLDRALKLAGAIAKGDDSTGFDLSELRQLKEKHVKSRQVETPKGILTTTDTTENQKQEAIQRRPDPWALVDRFLARVAHLEKARAEMLNAGGAGGDNPDEAARRIMAALDAMDRLSAPDGTGEPPSGGGEA